MQKLENVIVQCPYCWEEFETFLDFSGADSFVDVQQYTEDCYVCCRPIVFTVSLDENGQSTVEVSAELL